MAPEGLAREAVLKLMRSLDFLCTEGASGGVAPCDRLRAGRAVTAPLVAAPLVTPVSALTVGPAYTATTHGKATQMQAPSASCETASKCAAV